MSSLRRVVIAFSAGENDRRIAESLVLGFRKENLEAVSVHQLGELMAALDEKSPLFPDVLIAGTHLDLVQAVDGGIELVRALRQRTTKIARVPMFVVGEAGRRDMALIAGATDFIALPGQVMDVVTLAHIVTSAVEGAVARWQGHLATLPLIAIMRAMLTARRTGVLSLSRAGRQAELRFFEGELTALQVGARHGLAALHQALLWPDAHFDLRAETVVRRHQIVAAPTDIIKDAERFLAEFAEMTGGIPANAVLERNLERLADCEGQIPHAVLPVLQLFDGVRTLADVVEDSPFPLPATAKVAARLRELAVIKRLAGAPQATTAVWVAPESWPLGSPAPPDPPADAAPGSPAADAGDPIAARLKAKTKYKKRQRVPLTPAPGVVVPKIDWSAILGVSLSAGPPAAHAEAPAPSPAGSSASSITSGSPSGNASGNADGYAPLLPSMSVKGEITVRRSGSINSVTSGTSVGGIVTTDGDSFDGGTRTRGVTEPPRPGDASVEVAPAATTVLPVLPAAPSLAPPAPMLPASSLPLPEAVRPAPTAVIAEAAPPAAHVVPDKSQGRESVDPAVVAATHPGIAGRSVESEPKSEPTPVRALETAAAPASPPAAPLEPPAAAAAPEPATPIAIPPSGPMIIPVPVPVPRTGSSGAMPAQRASASGTMSVQPAVSASGHVDSGPATGPPPRDRTPTQPGVVAPSRASAPGARGETKPGQPAPPPMRTPERDHAKSEPPRSDHAKGDHAVHFSDDEEAFFADDSLLRPGAAAEDFSDLEDRPAAPQPSFWKRLFGKPPPNPRRASTTKGVPPPAGKKRKS